MEISKYNNLIELLFRGLSIYRWNNFPRIESVTCLDHTGFALHIALLLSYLGEENSNKKYDRGYIIRDFLFGIFFTTTHSDINHDVKEAIKRENPALLYTLKEKTYKQILEFPMHELFRAEMYASTISHKENTEIQSLIRYAKLYANLIEAKTNARVYPEVYARQIDEISERMNASEYIGFHNILPFDRESENHLFLMTIRRLQSTYRWNMDRRTYPVSVMSHLVVVLFFTYVLALEYSLNPEETTDVMITALYHDVPEGLTGDIITPTKEALPGIREVLERVEMKKVDSELLAYIGFSSAHYELRSRILSPWEMPNGSLIKLADHYSALYEAKIEIPTHPEMQEVYDRIAEIIKEKNKNRELRRN